MKIYESAEIDVKYPYYAGKGHIGSGTRIFLENLHMEEGAQINANCTIKGMGSFRMGKYSTVGDGVVVVTGTDTLHSKAMNDYAPDEERHIVRGTVSLGEYCFIGPNSVISISEKNPHILIGDHARVKALSYVGESVPPNMVYYRNPIAKVTAERLI